MRGSVIIRPRPRQRLPGAGYGSASVIAKISRRESVSVPGRAGTGRWIDRVGAMPRGSAGPGAVARSTATDDLRGTPKAFSGDSRAQTLVAQGIAADSTGSCRPDSADLYLSGFRALRAPGGAERGGVAFCRLAGRAAGSRAGGFAHQLDYAERHRQVIARFGPFPHRNAILGRESSAQRRHSCESQLGVLRRTWRFSPTLDSEAAGFWRHGSLLLPGPRRRAGRLQVFHTLSRYGY